MIRSLSAFARTRWRAHTLKTRADVVMWQAARLKSLMSRTLPSFPFYRQYGSDFADLPIIDKVVLMQDFASFNRASLSAEDGWAIFEGRSPQPRGLFVGASTGTSGNRGLYVVSEAERREWLGVVLAKALPRFPLETARIALILPLNSALYDAAADTPRLSLRFFDLHDGLEAILSRVEAYAPDTLIAPPKVLRALAQSGSQAALRRIFSGAEVLDPLDRAIIESHFGVRVREIYMATEGLLGVACEHGTLHLSEDVMHFEFEPVADGLVTPVVTDFTRTTQALCRYRLNDLLRLSEAPCPCGSPYQAVTAVEGRCDDVLSLNGRVFTPDILRNAIIDADRRINDFRLHQTGPDRLDLILTPDLPPEAADRARTAVAMLTRVNVTVRHETLTTSARKLRRVEKVWRS